MSGEKRARITINSTSKGERFIHFSTIIYLAPMYKALRSKVLNKTDKNSCPHGAYIPVGDGNKIHCMLYGGQCSEEKE